MTQKAERASRPTVSVVIPTYQEEQAIDACLEAVAAQTYPEIVETLVIDGRSTDDTRARAESHSDVTVVDNPGRIQAAALNIGIEQAKGDVIVRVDGHCIIAPDYVERCVAALAESGAAMTGGGMTPVASGATEEGIAAAMGSRFGAGPARFHIGGGATWVDTVYLGAYWTDLARRVGGYAEDVGVNEDAEFAHRIGKHGGVWFDPTIKSTYTPRSSLKAVAKQFYRYGKSRSKTAVRHPESVKPRQLVAPALVIGLLSPKRKTVLAAYAVGIAGIVATEGRDLGDARPTFAASLPVMHLSWGAGFLVGLAKQASRFLGRDGSS